MMTELEQTILKVINEFKCRYDQEPAAVLLHPRDLIRVQFILQQRLAGGDIEKMIVPTKKIDFRGGILQASLSGIVEEGKPICVFTSTDIAAYYTSEENVVGS